MNLPALQTKAQIRGHLLGLRNLLGPEEVKEKSWLIQTQVLGLKPIIAAKKVVLYAAARNEVLTDFLFEELRKKGKQVFFPRLKQDEMEFVEVTSLSTLRTGKLGILEPSTPQSLSLQGMDIAVIPGVGFDEAGFRIGFGKGYYDKTLHQFSGLKLGLAYDFQVLKKIAHEPWDIRCHYVVTECRVIEV